MKTLYISERTGHFDMLHPDDESCSVHFRLQDGEEKKYINLQFKQEQGITGYVCVEDALYLIDEWDKHTWFSSQREDVLGFKKLLKANTDNIDEGNKSAKIAELLKRRADLDSKLASLGHPPSFANPTPKLLNHLVVAGHLNVILAPGKPHRLAMPSAHSQFRVQGGIPPRQA